MRLLPDWRQAWRWWSVRVSALATFLLLAAIAAPDLVTGAWRLLPPEILARLPRNVALIVPLLLQLLTIIARLVRQQGPQQLLAGDARTSTKGKPIAGAIGAMIAAVLLIEGGWVNHPADPGGETNMGITKEVAIASGYAGPMRTLPREVATSIYYDRYLVASGYAPLADIDAAVTEELFDTAVNMGPARPSRWFQVSINELCPGSKVATDGHVGPGTIAAYAACQRRTSPALLCRSMLDALDARQRAEYDHLVAANPKLKVFHRGWIAKRIGNVDRATCMADRR